jgi:tRNA pseudouridine32 synthase/23S rRNA pseudouridine746 synthase
VGQGISNQSSALHAESQATPNYTINPLSNRRIEIGKSKWTEFMDEGGWINHNGGLTRIALEQLQSSGTEGGEEVEQITQDYEQHTSNENDRIEILTPTINFSTGAKGTETQILNDLLFVNKPSGMLCVPGRGPDKADCLTSRVQAMVGPEAKPCHRLDRDTSGIVVFGLTPEAHSEVSQQFQNRQTTKTYMTLVAGHPVEKRGLLSWPIGKQLTEEGHNRWVIGGEKPRDSTTKWRVNQMFDVEGAKFSRVELRPLTGRGHQLRLHMAAMGNPILGDTLHSPPYIATASPRMCLHAHRLQFNFMGCIVAAESMAPF